MFDRQNNNRTRVSARVSIGSAASTMRAVFLAGFAIAALMPSFAHAGPAIEHWTLSNGARVYFVAARELPMVEARVIFDAGAARDPADKAGLAQLANTMLREGVAGSSADDIASRFESLGAEFSTGAERDMATADLRSLTDPALLEPALDLFAQVLAAPIFPQDSLDRERARMLVALAKEAQSPGAMVQKVFMRALYAGHPYAHAPLGDEDSLKRIVREDLSALHRRYYVGRNAWLVMIGNLDLPQARRVAEKIVGGLAAGESAPPLPPIPALQYSRLERVSFPATQSHLLLGQAGIARNDLDYYPLYVGNHILGGSGLVSRLAEEIREKRGLAYSVYSYFAPMRLPGPFVMGLQTKNASRDEALNLLRKALDEFIEKGPTAKELQAAQRNITGGFPLRLDSNRKIADQLAVIAFYGMRLTYLEEFSARIDAVTIEQVRDAFARRVRPDLMLTAVVGGEP